MNRRVVLVGALVLAAGGAAWLLRTRAPVPPSRHNLLLITLDTTRADRLGCYGYEKGSTPNLDALASDGVAFDAAYVPTPLTLPSHCSIMTGANPTFHRIRYNGTYALPASAVTLAEQCKQAGMTCGAAVGAYVLHSQFGLAQGFDEYDDAFREEERPASDVTDAGIAFLRRHEGARWFLWLHYFDPHFPREPPSEFKRRFPNDGYDGEVAYMDSQIGRLLAELGRQDVDQRTLICVVADHGEGLGDHEPTHGMFLYEPTVRVPLILHAPHLLPAGRRVPDVVRTIDLHPTLCELLEIPSSPAAQGRSLAALWQAGDTETREVYFETFVPHQIFGWSHLLGVRQGPWKYIRAPRSELYDVVADPGEQSNVIGQHADAAQRLDARLSDLVDETSRGGQEPGTLANAVDRDKIAALGYASGDSGAPSASGPALVDPKDRRDAIEMHRNAAALSQANDVQGAIGAYRAILVKYPDDFKAMSQLGELLSQDAKIDEAIELYERVTRLRADSVVGYRALAFLYFLKGRLDDAAREVDSALRILPDSNQTHCVRSLILEQQNRPAESLAAVERSLEIDPHYDPAMLQRGRLLARMNRFGEAAEVLKKIDAASKNRFAALSTLQDVYRRTRREAEGAAVAREMSQLRAAGRAFPPQFRLVGGGY